MALQEAHDGGEVAGLGDHLDILLGIEQPPHAAAHQIVIVGQDDTDRG